MGMFYIRAPSLAALMAQWFQACSSESSELCVLCNRSILCHHWCWLRSVGSDHWYVTIGWSWDRLCSYLSHRFLQQGLCQKEKPLDNSLYSDGIGTDIGAHLFLLPRTLSWPRPHLPTRGFHRRTVTTYGRVYLRIPAPVGLWWCYSVCISHRLYNKDCAKREDLWTAVFVPMTAVMCDSL